MFLETRFCLCVTTVAAAVKHFGLCLTTLATVVTSCTHSPDLTFVTEVWYNEEKKGHCSIDSLKLGTHEFISYGLGWAEVNWNLLAPLKWLETELVSKESTTCWLAFSPILPSATHESQRSQVVTSSEMSTLLSVSMLTTGMRWCMAYPENHTSTRLQGSAVRLVFWSMHGHGCQQGCLSSPISGHSIYLDFACHNLKVAQSDFCSKIGWKVSSVLSILCVHKQISKNAATDTLPLPCCSQAFQVSYFLEKLSGHCWGPGANCWFLLSTHTIVFCLFCTCSRKSLFEVLYSFAFFCSWKFTTNHFQILKDLPNISNVVWNSEYGSQFYRCLEWPRSLSHMASQSSCWSCGSWSITT